MYGYHHTGAFRPSPYADYGTAGQVARDTTRVAATTALTGGTAAASLAVAAGSVAAVPVAGWVAAGVLGGAAGIVALVGAVKSGKARKRDAVALARRLKIAEPDKAPGFIVRALRLSDAKRRKLIARYKRRIARISKRRNRLFARARARRLARLRWRLQVLEALHKIAHPKYMTEKDKRAAALVARQRRLPPREAVNEDNSPGMDPEEEDRVEAKAEKLEEKKDPVVGAAPKVDDDDDDDDKTAVAKADAAAPAAAGGIPPWGWALGAVVVIGGFLMVSNKGKSKKGE
jgi:hypothetical protein